MSAGYLRRVYWRLTGVMMLVVIGALAANSYLSHRAFEEALVPEMEKKAASVGASVRLLIQKAVGYHIPFAALYGVEEAFRNVRHENRDFAYIAATNLAGDILYEDGQPAEGATAYFRDRTLLAELRESSSVVRTTRIASQDIVSLPIEVDGEALGALHVGIDVGFVDDLVLEMMYDVLVILVVTLFFTLELLNWIAGTRLDAGLKSLAAVLHRGGAGDFNVTIRGPGDEFSELRVRLENEARRVNDSLVKLDQDVEAARFAPIHERKAEVGVASAAMQKLRERFRFGAVPSGDDLSKDAALAKVRAPLFAFILAEELTRSFLPGYVQQLLVSVAGLSPQVVIGLPIVLFMLIVALAQPYLGAFCERIGHRRAMVYGAAIAGTGFLATMLSVTVLDLLLWRSLCAIGYALVFVAAQGYVLVYTTPSNRARGFALFVGAIMVATVCGPSIGGILADNLGERPTFAIAAVIAFCSIMVMRTLPRDGEASAVKKSARPPRLSEVGALLFNRRFMTLTGLAAVPAKLILTGICFYLMPLYVVSVGSTLSMAGRILMIYGVVMVVMGPVAAGWATNRRNRELLVAGGLCASGFGGLLMLASGSVLVVFIAVLIIGFGQSLSISAQSALVSDHCAEDIARMGDGAVYGVYRLLERLGNALGPLLASLLVIGLGYEQTFIAFGALVMACGIAFTMTIRLGRSPTSVTAG
jgi:MFS family permease/HAMP domain-containing protein